MSTRKINGHGAGPALPARPVLTPIPEPIAIIGIGCRFPGRANDPESFWTLLEDRVDAITEVPADRWEARAFYDPDPARPGKTYSRWGGFVEGIDRFDPQCFGISPREAARMDPQQRLLLEVAWEALEDAGLPLAPLAGSPTAVFVGISSFDYSVLETSFRDRGGIDVYSNTGGSLSIAANRISYTFDFRGPGAAVDTACSSALVAVHLACQSLWRDGCRLALAGGVNALLLPDWYVGFCRMGLLSPEGRCRAFDARAGGFVRSEGAGVVVLKHLAQAIADGDRVYAVIRATAVNQDGRTPGMTVPNQEAQEALLRQACRAAGVSPAMIGYVEAHGTGTAVGDPIEARALGRVLSAGRPAGQPCLIGSVKTNIGHLEAGAGIAGLIKVALALHHRRIPGNLHFERPNPEIDFDALRLRVPTHGEPWPDLPGPDTAGVNAFGFGGTNAHVILQEAPSAKIREGKAPSEPLGAVRSDKVSGAVRSDKVSPSQDGRMTNGFRPRAWLVPLSARSPAALRAAAGAWCEFLARSPRDVTLEDLAANAALRRTHHDHRLAVVASSKPELAEALGAFASGRPAAGTAEGRAAADRRPRLAFVCAGQGPQWWAMGRQLLDSEPIFRAVIERCDAIVRRLGDWSLLGELTAEEGRSRLDVTAIAQPCLFALQAALSELWASWGVRPEAVVGHSVGEVAAAHLAGILGLEDAVRVIYQRGRCMERAPERGRMLAAGLSPEEARRLIAGSGGRVALAAENSPCSVTLSGEPGPLEEIAARLEARGVFARFLKVRYAFHSAQMDPIRDELLAALEGIRPRPATLPFFSTVTGGRIEGPELGPGYWWENVRRTVRFADGVARLGELGLDTFIELSPHPVLAAAVTECCQHRGRAATALPSLRRHAADRATMLRSLGALHVLGHPVDWAGVLPGPRRFIRLPLYPWQRERFWHEAEESRASRLSPPAHPLLGVAQDGARPAWEARLDLRLAPYLADHRVQQATILPATAYLELAFAAAREALGPVGCELRDVKLANPCFLAPDRPLRTQTSFDPAAASVQVDTRPADGGREWTVHLTATLHPRPAEAEPAAFSPEAIRRRCPAEFAPDPCYEYLRRIGLDYGPLFRGIERVWQGDRESLGLVRLPEALAQEADESLFHPALFDACLQVVIPADGDFDRRDGGLYLPSEIEAVRLLHRPGRRVWVHARLLEKTPRRSLADVEIYDEDGRPVARIRGLRSHRIAGGRDEALDDLLYAYQWLPQPRPAAEVTPEGPGRWLIFADGHGVGARLADHLRERGEVCTVARAGLDFEELGAGLYRLDPGQPDQVVRLVQAFAAPGPLPIRGVIHLRNLDATLNPREGAAPPEPRPGEAPAPPDAAPGAPGPEAGLLSVVLLVQAWDRVIPDRSARLFLVTRGAQSVGDRPEPTELAQAPAIGLGRVIAGEYPRLRCKLVDLDPRDQDGGARRLLAEVLGEDEEDEVALRGPERYAHRFLPAPGLPASVAEEPARGVASYRLTIPRPGTLDCLVLQAIRRRPPGPGEVEIEVATAGLNFSDVMKTLGLYPGLAEGPVPLGAECSGRVATVGEGVAGLRVGDEVLAVAGFAFASHALARAELVVPKPAGLGFEEAATLPIAFLTASYALEYLGRLGPGERVLIHSASGGVGLAAVQLARRAGAEVFATAGTPEKRAHLLALGIEAVMDSRSLDFADEVRRRTDGRGVDVILNSLPGEAIPRGLGALADYGRFLEIGKRDIYRNARLGLEPFRNNLSFFAIDLDRVIRERPALLGSLLRDIVRRVRDGELDPLPHRAWPITEAVDALRIMQQGQHIGKVVLSLRDPPAAVVPAEDEPVRFRRDGSYLLTGGLGGFGMEVARWMAGRGAGHLILLGRRGAETPGAREAIAELERLGAQVVVRAADVSKADDLAAVLAEIDRQGPQLRGVVHAAMVLEDALLTNLDRERMERVLAPKVGGSWNLHIQTAGRPLDFFVLFSSLSSVFGHAGQGSYAAANAFLDALAWHRRALGLPALTVNWGYLGEVGYLARRAELGERLERQGVLSFTVGQALTLLERAMQRRHVQVSAMRVEWSRWRGLGVTGRVSPRFAHLCRPAEPGRDQAGPATVPGRDALLAAGTAERRALVEAMLRDRLGRVLGTDPDRLDGEKPLLQLGLDSLMAVELRNWIEGELRVNLPIVELMRSPSLSRLADILAESTGQGGQAPPAEPGPSKSEGPTDRRAAPPSETPPAELLARVEELSGEQVDALLSALLGATGRGLDESEASRAGERMVPDYAWP
jgi:polyketide synthase 12/epothilone polyketide synthase D